MRAAAPYSIDAVQLVSVGHGYHSGHGECQDCGAPAVYTGPESATTKWRCQLCILTPPGWARYHAAGQHDRASGRYGAFYVAPQRNVAIGYDRLRRSWRLLVRRRTRWETVLSRCSEPRTFSTPTHAIKAAAMVSPANSRSRK